VLSRSVFAVDGTFLKSLFRGTLLLACQRDANNENLILCLAVVDCENNETWSWFMSLVVIDFPGIKVVLADYASGLQIIWNDFAFSFSRCVKHMIANMISCKDFSGGGGTIISDLVNELAKAPNEPYYAHVLNELRFTNLLHCNYVHIVLLKLVHQLNINK